MRMSRPPSCLAASSTTKAQKCSSSRSPGMRVRDRSSPASSIVFTSSAIVAQPNPLTIDYGASKAAITHLTRSLARQLAPAGIRVNAVAPGLTLTPFLSTQGIRSENIPMLTANSPYGRILQPAEIAPLYVAVVDPLKTGVSGEIFTAAAAVPGP